MNASDVPRPFNLYLDPEDAKWLDSMEGVPDAALPVELPGERLLRAAWQKRLHRGLDWVGGVAPGLALAGGLAWVGALLADWIGESILGFDKSPISAILMTIVLGLLVRNLAGLPAAYEKGLRLAVRRVLRWGIALLGLQMSLAAVGQISALALPIVVGCIASALILVTWLGRVLSVPPRLASLIAVGTSICGASAIVATGPAIDAEEDEVSYAVACITLFGMIALFVYPFLGHWLFAADATRVGLFLGTAIHETAQVAGAGLMYQQHYHAPEALLVAATTKLVRNVCMGVVIPLMAILYHRRKCLSTGGRDARSLRWHQYVPSFVIAFVVLAAVRSAGDLGEHALGLFDRGAWAAWMDHAKTASVACMTVAMAAVGLGTSASQLQSLGWRPLLVGLTAAILVGGVSFVLVAAIAPLV
jgi:uncharacterized integral membrane protein (TIGR00698 family)